MKKYLWVLLVALALLISGCAKEEIPVPQPSTIEESTIPETTTAPETTAAETTAETAPPYDISKVDAYLATVKEEADRLEYYLENEAMNQLDMNETSWKIYELWDGALNYLWGELKATMPEAEFESLLTEQRAWLSEKGAAVNEAAKEVAGGSMSSLIINSVGAEWTEARVYYLYALLQ